MPKWQKVLGDIDTDDEGRRSGEPAIVAVEAGTGTGKTVAYSLAAIPTAKAAGKRLVIATATVALQEQIVYKDLPDLMRNSGLNFTFALAKGRGRYMCLSKLDMLLQEGHAQTATAQLFEEEGFKIEVDEASQKLFTSMIEKLAGNKWDGDRDSWSTALEDADWSRLTTDHSQCTNRHCPNFGQCAFYKAREGMGKVDVIVTNHDMVLADLALGGGAVLPDPRDTIYVFDEGHHLPDKAIGHFAHYTRLRSTADWLETTAKNLTKLLAQHPLPGDLGKFIEQVPELAREIKTNQQFMFTACEQVADFKPGEDVEGRERPRHRFVGGVIPEHMREMGIELKKGFARLTDLFTRLTDLLKEGMDGEVNIGIASNQAEEWYPLFGSLLSRSQGNWELWTAFTAEDPGRQPANGAVADPGRKRFAVRYRGQCQPDPGGGNAASQPVERGLWRAGDVRHADRPGHVRPLPHARRPAEESRDRRGPEPLPPRRRRRAAGAGPQGRSAGCRCPHGGDHPRPAGTGGRLTGHPGAVFLAQTDAGRVRWP
nr:hypothetical protein GCM10020185_15210 [Pseudomonas brassicacearum subsp. brassicacearum]